MLSQTAEYALRAVAALAPTAGRLVPTTDLAKLADVPPPYLAKVLQQLASAGIIKGRRGVGGGYALNRPSGEISLLEVVLAVGPLREPRSSSELDAQADGMRRLNEIIDGSAAYLRTTLAETTVADVAQDTDQLDDNRPAVNASSNGRSAGQPESRSENRPENGVATAGRGGMVMGSSRSA